MNRHELRRKVKAVLAELFDMHLEQWPKGSPMSVETAFSILGSAVFDTYMELFAIDSEDGELFKDEPLTATHGIGAICTSIGALQSQFAKKIRERSKPPVEVNEQEIDPFDGLENNPLSNHVSAPSLVETLKDPPPD